MGYFGFLGKKNVRSNSLECAVWVFLVESRSHGTEGAHVCLDSMYSVNWPVLGEVKSDSWHKLGKKNMCKKKKK